MEIPVGWVLQWFQSMLEHDGMAVVVCSAMGLVTTMSVEMAFLFVCFFFFGVLCE